MDLGDDEYDEYFKVIVVGNSGTGKTKIIQTFDKGIKPTNTAPTVGVDYCAKNIHIEPNRRVKMQIWDTAGQQQYKSITMGHYRNAAGALVVYDVANRASFQSASEWIGVVRQRADDNVMIGLIANKIDLPSSKRVVTQEQGQYLANMMKVFYKETTVEDVSSLRSAFQRLATEIDRINKTNNLQFSKNSVHLNQNHSSNNDSCPC